MALHYVPIDRWTYFNDRQVFDISFRPDLKLLEPHLKPAHFKQHDILFQADEEIRHVYFPPGAVVSLVICLSSGEMIEAAMVGRAAWSVLPQRWMENSP